MRKAEFSFIFLLFTLISFSQNENLIEGFSVESMPVFEGRLEKFIEKHIQYPMSALKDSIEGRVFVSFWVDSLGNTSKHTLILGIREDLNQEALRVAKLIKFSKPAMQNGKPVKVKYTLPFDFNLSNIKGKTSCNKRSLKRSPGPGH
ncbi:MAG TPA: energy transducer TonB [Bacteroidales bacterium]|nr:energy transducer TonB [Bacteroidales bacterium]HOK74783.1 energy transducer TonB [Bacteroidales bacterium]HOM41702.1 energy transducer TonB [Bacteroidales bacterium]HPP93478.1 energy transducer TonB [Bacteroidales bacterium]HQG56244.1 energy transducer TonB [Bacteroidales bacterium]